MNELVLEGSDLLKVLIFNNIVKKNKKILNNCKIVIEAIILL